MVVQTVVMSGVRPDEEGIKQDDVDMESAGPQGGSVVTSGAVATRGVTVPTTASGTVGVSGGSTTSVLSLVSVGRQGPGGQRGRPPQWSKLPCYKKHKKVLFIFCFVLIFIYLKFKFRFF